jgi:tetratricopeptide (TPR) repeat protein
MCVRQAVCFGIVLAIASALTGLGQNAKPPDPNRQAALKLEQEGKNLEAEAAWRVYLKTHMSSPEPYAHMGLLEARQEHYKQAVPLYRKALEIGPDVPGLRLNLGLALFKGGDPKAAIAEFERLLKAQPGNQQLNTLIGMAHYGLAEYADAVPYLKQAAANDPQNLPLRLALAHSCLWSKQNQCVMDVYHEILSLNSESAEADMVAGEAMDEMKDNEGSTKMFRAAVKANPKEPNVHFGLGYLLWSQKQYKEAASEFEAELANDPDHIQAKLYLADTDVQMNQIALAGPLLEKVVQANPAIGLGHLDLGIVYSEANRNADALRELNAAAKIIPNDVNVHWRLARLYRTLGKKEEAKAEFDKASTLNKAADDDLYKKIANGHAPPPDASAPAADTPPDH